MRAHGHTTVWDAHVITGRSGGKVHWLEHLSQWIMAHRVRRREAILGAQQACWDGIHEQLRRASAASSLEYAAAQGGPARAMNLYSASLYMSSSSC